MPTMKIRTVTALAALGMLLSSLGVRSLTSSADARPNDWKKERTTRNDQGSGERGAGKRSFGGGALDLEARLGHERLGADRQEETFLLVNVRGDANAEGRDARRHLAILVDRSGSMQGRKIESAIEAAQGAIRRLGDSDFVSVVDYATTASVLVSPAEVSGARDRAIRAVSALRPSGDTCISCALDEGRALLRERSGFVSRVLLLSDGEATTGVRDMEGMRRVAESVRNSGATVTTIGIGVDYNERMMAGIARETNGHHHFAETADALAGIFDRELRGLERSVAREARLEFELAPGVELVEVADRSFSREGSRVTVPLGAFAAGEERTVLAKVRVQAGSSGERTVATARLRYEDLGSGKSDESQLRLAAVFTDDGSRSRLDPVVEERIERSSTVTALDDANDLFKAGNVVAARRRVEAKLDEVRKGRTAAIAAAPAAKRELLTRDFDAQEAALGQAQTGFAEPPAASGPGAEKSKAALKRNQVEALELAH
jgi:Ca-activated chloride channel family protein